MERRALGPRRFADGNRGKEIRLALDGRGAGALGQVHDGSNAAEVVGQRHNRSAMENIGNGGEFLAYFEFGFDAVGRHVSQLDPQKRGERRLKVARVSHDNVLNLTSKNAARSLPFSRPRS